ncbi:type II toxin-antitoxin system HicA family toxin [Micromonospora chersina]|uniref:type II toxin-antitoxin system HicA family toxin n=1 Tax=Micromonospora TaxID=1873 RepID=UPI0033D27C28
MKRDALLKKITKAAKAAEVDFGLEREGSKHSIYRYGTQAVTIPRHREINEQTARGILRDLGIE